jgi:hypothetical protein
VHVEVFGVACVVGGRVGVCMSLCARRGRGDARTRPAPHTSHACRPSCQVIDPPGSQYMMLVMEYLEKGPVLVTRDQAGFECLPEEVRARARALAMRSCTRARLPAAPRAARLGG